MSGLWLIFTMAVFGHRGRRNKKTSVGTLLCLMCLFIFSFASLPEAQEVSLQENKTCKLDEFLTEDGICCNKCGPGFKLLEKCHGPKERSNCIHCPDGQYIDQMNYSNNCRQCKTCKAKHEIEESPCNRSQNTKCRCKDGYYRYIIDSLTYDCLRCKKCKADEVERGTCSPDNNTVCGCKDNYYKVKGKCEPCKSCSSECSSLCKSPTTVFPEVTKSVNPDGYVINVISGTGAVIIVLLVLVVFITYMLTKRYTKKRILRSSQRSDASQESCEQVLVNSEEHLETSVKEFPQSAVAEVEGSKLPDCVPLEIKLSELIYTVLDLVPVVQVKQLVRLLGVTDTEIEQAELDYRSCREAHYQMLRAWGSRSGGGGRGGMLHRPLLKELLEKLRMMHLGKAAEELETKYGIQ
ncbi:tumor necrosis factor receptor superfamily member 1A isoform X2 [Archocentrus centrarchus]|uniref:tumor necrosis factor receptor superfamily member 1A isoform X2 n=1 Tax=Archocentrus centrarchus TaxID=63155 RepID=UPI0011EA010F|nr:tumor necrosis factor receptor superfamily member 6-like isoform X2 [Archocentrus centrarchus]